MKITAICGSPRKGNTYQTLNSIKENYPNLDYKILMLKELDFNLCRGCYTCITRGEDKCPIKDDKDLIIKEMLDADGIILASPVYSHMISAMMKNYFDRLGFFAHRPQFFDKYAISVATCSGFGAEEAIKYMNKMLSVFGFNLISPLEIQIRPGKTPEKNKVNNANKIKKSIDELIARINKGGRDKPSMNLLIPFNIFKYVAIKAKETMTADYEYYKDKKDYYYDTKIPFLKRFITRKVVNKIIAEFD